MRRNLLLSAAGAVALTLVSAVAVSASVSPSLLDKLNATLSAPVANGVDQRQKDYNQALHDEIVKLEERVTALEKSAGSSPPPAPLPMSALWTAGMEAGTLDEWKQGLPAGGGEYNDGTGASITSMAAARTGTYGLRQTADAAVGGNATRMFRWAETRSHTRTIQGAWYRFPANIFPGAPSNFFNLAQFKSVDPLNPSTNVPAWVLGLKVRDNLNYLYLAEHDLTNGNWISHNAPAGVNLPAAGTWVWIEMELHQSDTTTGRVIVRSGTDRASLTTVLDKRNVQTKATGHENVWSTNCYPGEGTTQGGSTTITVDVDDVEISAVVAPTVPGLPR